MQNNFIITNYRTRNNAFTAVHVTDDRVNKRSILMQ